MKWLLFVVLLSAFSWLAASACGPASGPAPDAPSGPRVPPAVASVDLVTRPASIIADTDTTGTASEAYAPARYRLQPGELVLAADEDDIPAIFADDAFIVDAEDGSREWQDDELVIGLILQGDARAYPIRLLSSHEIVNDVVGGQPVAITWCPLCYSALVFDRVVERELTFGVSGYLFHNNLVMYDHQTNTLWSQILAQGIRGALNGQQLNLVSSQLMEWGQWKALYPETRILSAESLGKQADSIVDPYAGYYASGVAGLVGSPGDERLPAKALVVGLVVGGEARAYPLSELEQHSLVNDQLGSLPLLLVYDPELQTVWAYRRHVNDETLTFQANEESGSLRDEETASTWDVRSGAAVAGPQRGTRLQRLSAPLVYWFAWSAIYPQTDLKFSE